MTVVNIIAEPQLARSVIMMMTAIAGLPGRQLLQLRMVPYSQLHTAVE